MHLFLRGQQYKTLKFHKSFLSISSNAENCVFLNENNDVFLIENILKVDDCVYLIGRKFQKKENMYSYPLSSSLIHEFMVSELSSNLECIPICVVKCKAFRIPLTIPCGQSFFVSPLINHSFK